tara:strand:+ start:1946 stop:3244 length:1299 start_codon:yes stop_codon:yes gene_type:complete
MIILYFLLILFIGFIQFRNNTEKEYFFLSRKLTFYSFIASIVTTWYGGILEIGNFSYHNGIVTWIIFGAFYYISAIIFGIFIGPRIYKKNIESIPKYFRKNYGLFPGIIVSLIILTISSPAPYIMILAILISHILNIKYYYAIMIGMITSISYVSIGGFKSIIKTDKIQFLFMFLGFFIILAYLNRNYGGIQFLINNVPKENLTITGNLPIGYILSWSFISMIAFIDPNIFQRTYAANNTKTIKYGLIVSVVFWFIFDLLSISIGIYASAIIKPENLIGNPYLMLADNFLPPLLKNIFYISMLSIVMSTIDSFSFVSATTFGNDLINSKDNKIRNTQIGLLFTSIIALIIIFFFNRAIDIWYVFGSIAASAILIPFLLLIYNFKRIKRPAICLILPIISCAFWIYAGYPYNIDAIYPGLLTSIIANYFSLRE